MIFALPVTFIEIDSSESCTCFAKRNQFPYIVRIYSLEKVRSTMTVCTGIIISHNLVLTAAHCLDIAYEIIIVHGDPDHDNIVTNFGKCIHSDRHFCYYAKNFVLHPQYEFYGLEQYDVAIIRLFRPMPISDDHQIFNCSSLGHGNPKNCTIFGWGLSDDNKTDHKLRYKTNISTVPCRARDFIPKHICLSNQHTCKGDFGGPLICDNKIYGIFSYATFWQDDMKYPPKCEDHVHDYYVPVSLVSDFLREHADCKAATAKKNDVYTILAVLFHLIYFHFTVYKSLL